MNRLSLSHLTVLEVGPPELVTLAADAGFSSLGVRLHPPTPGGTAYPLRPGSVAMIETRRRMADRGVEVFDVEVVRLASDTDVRGYAPMFDAAAELGAKRLCVNVDDPDRARTIDRFAELCDLAKLSNLGVDLEFMVWRPVARIADAVEIVRAAGRSNGAILIDALHLFRSGGSASAIAALDPALIGSVQLCDARAEAPDPSEIIDEARGNRLPPGEGALPLSELVAALPENVTFGPRSPHVSHSAVARARARATRARSRQRIPPRAEDEKLELRVNVTHEHFVRLVVADSPAKGRHMKRSPTLRAVNRPIDVHMTIAVLGIFNVRNEYTFEILFQRPMGAKGDVSRRRAMTADIVLH